MRFEASTLIFCTQFLVSNVREKNFYEIIFFSLLLVFMFSFKKSYKNIPNKQCMTIYNNFFWLCYHVIILWQIRWNAFFQGSVNMKKIQNFPLFLLVKFQFIHYLPGLIGFMDFVGEKKDRVSLLPNGFFLIGFFMES